MTATDPAGQTYSYTFLEAIIDTKSLGKDYYLIYIPQKNDDNNKWNYDNEVCQSNRTMCTGGSGGGSGGAIVGAVGGVCCLGICGFGLFKMCSKNKDNTHVEEEPKEEEAVAEGEEVMVNPGYHQEQMTSTTTTTTTGGLVMGAPGQPPPAHMMQPGMYPPTMTQPGMMMP